MAKFENLTQPFLEPIPRPIVRPLPPDDAARASGAHPDCSRQDSGGELKMSHRGILASVSPHRPDWRLSPQ
jgi:hypothetical protein